MKKQPASKPTPPSGFLGISAARPFRPSAVQVEMEKVQLAIMKADLRLHIAQADLAETTAKRAKNASHNWHTP